jgi:hypothetical protein
MISSRLYRRVRLTNNGLFAQVDEQDSGCTVLLDWESSEQRLSSTFPSVKHLAEIEVVREVELLKSMGWKVESIEEIPNP